MKRQPLKVTMVFEDNPLAGLPGQNDIQITVSGEPDIPLGPDGKPSAEDQELLLGSGAYCAAIVALAHVCGISESAALMVVARGSRHGEQN